MMMMSSSSSSSLLRIFFFWLLLLRGSAIPADRRTLSLSSNDVAANDNLSSFQPRIIGGFNATQGRFPYYAALALSSANGGGFQGGGALIAPDIVLTAAHAWLGPTRPYFIQVGRYNQDDVNDNYEEFVATHYIPYPYYGIETTFSRDYMIIVLNGTSTKPPIRINRNATLPLNQQPLTIVGLGTINPDAIILPPILQQVSVNAIPNQVCEQANDNTTSYQGQITKEMICASSPGKDSCNGDSGGPLIIPGDNNNNNNNSASGDLLVGVASWGNACASPIFPGVYARVSSVMAWIDATVCRYSKNPPASFACPSSPSSSSSNTFSPAPTRIPTSVPSTVIPITVDIRFQFQASQTWWFILDARGNVVFLLPRFTYTDSVTHIQQQVDLTAGQLYTFVIKSEGEFSQGLAGSYVVSLGRPSQPTGPVLVSGGGASSFNQEERTNFTISSTSTSAPTIAPSKSQSPSLSLAPTPVQQTITLYINMGEAPSDLGYYIMNDSGKTVVNATFGTFATPFATVKKAYHLPSNRKYKFVIQSQGGIGLAPGNYSLALGAPNQGGPLLFFGNGTYTFEQSFSFFLPLSFTAVPSTTPSEPPTLVPTTTASPTTPVQTVTLIINFNFRPSQIGFFFTDSSNHVVVNVPVGTFPDSKVSVAEVYHLHSEQNFTFTIQNSRFNGLFPGNYTILLGLPNGGGPILVFSKGIFFSEETRSFFLPSSSLTTSNPSKRPQGDIPSFAPAQPTAKPTSQPSRIPVAPLPAPIKTTAFPTRRRTPKPTYRASNIMSTKIPKMSSKPAKKVTSKEKGGRKVKVEPTGSTKFVKREKGHPKGFPKSIQKSKSKL